MPNLRLRPVPSLLIFSSDNEDDIPAQHGPIERSLGQSNDAMEIVAQDRGAEDGSAENPAVVDESLNEGGSPPPKKRRVARKLTPWMFVDHYDNGKMGWCKLGCLNHSGSDRHSYSITSTTSISRHVEAKHPSFSQKFKNAQDNRYNVATLEKEVQEENEKVMSRLAKLKSNAGKFFRKVSKGLDHKVKCELQLFLWSIESGVSRLALNSPLFDSFLTLSGITTVANRHS